MRIAVVRGPSLNEWEMQNWLPLARRHELLLVGSRLAPFPGVNLSNAQGPVGSSSQPTSSAEKLSVIDSGNSSIRFIFDRVLRALAGTPSTAATLRNKENRKAIKVVRPFCLGEILGEIPLGIKLTNAIWGDPRMLWGLERIVSGYDVVCTAETRSYYSLQSVRAKKKGLVKRVAVTVWENMPFLGDENQKVRRIKDEVRREADWFLAVTNQARDVLALEGVDEKKIAVVPMGVDQSKFKVKSQKRSFSFGKARVKREGEVKILSVGRLVPEKGFDDLILAMAILAKDKLLKSKFHLTIVGEGPEEERLREMTENQGLSRVVVFKKASYDQMPKIYQEHDILVLASKPIGGWQEQYGMVLCEAASCGLAIIASRSGAIGEVLGKNALFFTPRDFWQLAELIAELIKNPKLRRETGQRLQAMAAQKFDSRKVAKILEGHLN